MRPPSASELHVASLASWSRHLEGGSALLPSTAAALRQSLGDGTLADVATRTFRARAAQTLLDIDGRGATGDELLSGAASVAAHLEASGTRAGARVLLALPSSIEFATAYFGVHTAGCSAILVNPSLTAAELGRLIAVGAPHAGLVSPEVLEVLAAHVVPGATTVLSDAVALVVFSDTGGRVGESARGDGVGSERGPGDEAVLAWTSGSTGEPKGVPLSHGNLLASIRAVMAAWRWDAGDTVVHSLPLYHQHGLGALHALALGGGRTVIRSHFDPDDLAATVEAERGSVLLAVPAVYQRLVEAGLRREQFSTLRLAISGSAPLPPALFDEVTALLGIAPLERYGMTESGLDVSNLYDGPRKPGAIGYPLPGVEAAVVGADGEMAAPGEDGEIWLRGPQVFSGYLGGAGSDAFPGDGWLRTGDIGRIDPDDGAMSITGRAKDIIISGGINVFPREVELVIEQHASVAAVAVGGVPSKRWGEEVVAFVVARAGATPLASELDELCRHSLASYKRPKRFVFVEDLPRNHMGKIVRSSLADLAPAAPDDH